MLCLFLLVVSPLSFFRRSSARSQKDAELEAYFKKLEDVRLLCPIQSIELLYKEWHGLGAFEGKPIAGGFKALEDKYQAKWRKTWTGADEKFLSRCKAIIGYIDSKDDKDEAIAMVQSLYVGVDCKLAKLVDKMKDDNMIVAKGSRHARRAAQP